MLEKLIIDNVAVIEHAEADFTQGLNVLTGETGAGKSIVIDSINLVLGRRSNREIIRTGATMASVTAVFSNVPLQIMQDITPDEDGKLILERIVMADGRGNAKINGKTVSVSQLRELGERLAGIHGQHDNSALLDAEHHISFLDEYAMDSILLSAYRDDYEKLKHLAERIRSLKIESRDRERRLELLRYQVNEIDNAAIGKDEEQELLKKRELIRNNERITEALSACFAALSNDGGAVELLRDASKAVDGTDRLLPELVSIKERIDNSVYDMIDCIDNIHRLLEDNGIGDIDSAEVEARLDIIRRLKSKYGSGYDDIIEYRNNSAKEVEQYSNIDELIIKLTAEYSTLLAETRRYAEKLSEQRHVAADKLCTRVQEELEFLNMGGSQFYAKIEPSDALLPNGMDVVEFMLSANMGEIPRPLAKIASGGELSRIMLAIKNALSEQDGIQTQIFDEIDTGVSGRAAQRIGIKLREISKGRQILCVTHLAQIAAYADCHLLTEKKTENGRTFTHITQLEGNGRINELARIMSGEAAGNAARTGALELLNYAEKNI